MKQLTAGAVRSMVAAWTAAVEAVSVAQANERELREQLIARYGSSAADAEGAHTSEDEWFSVTVTHKLNRKLDTDGLPELIKKHPEASAAVPLEYKLSLAEFRRLPAAASRALSKHITVTPGLASVAVKRKDSSP